MKYFRLYCDLTSKSAVFPQIETFDYRGMYWDPNQLTRKSFRPIDNQTIIPYGKLERRRKITDLMSLAISANDFFITPALNECLSKWPSSGIQFAETKLQDKQGPYTSMYVMHGFETFDEILDMKQTKIEKFTGVLIHMSEKVHFHTQLEFIEARREAIIQNEFRKPEEYIMYYITHPVFLPELKYDLISLWAIKPGIHAFFVSEQLHDELLGEGFSGLSLTPSDQPLW